jgi:hypothetical protein
MLLVALAHMVQGFALAVPVAGAVPLARAGRDKPRKTAEARRVRASVLPAALPSRTAADFCSFATGMAAAIPILCIAI